MLEAEAEGGARNTVAAVPSSVRAVPAVCTPRWWLGSAATPQRYAHLDNDPLRRASKAIAGRIAAALGGNAKAVVLPLRGHAYIDLELGTGFRENI